MTAGNKANINWSKIWGAMLTAVLGVTIILYLSHGPNSQWHNLNLVREWLQDNEQEIVDLKTRFPELEQTNIFAFTGGDGMVGVITPFRISEEAELALLRFLANSEMPRPLMYRYRKERVFEGGSADKAD